jgi:Lon protease-like protein
MEQQLTRACDELPVFPLPRTVLMPGALLPLHVFEPRYRALVSHCIETHKYMGVGTLQPGFEDDYYGTPPIYPEIGIGMVVAHQPFPDGRSNIVLQFVGRGRVIDELLTQHPFRLMKSELVASQPEGRKAALASLRMLVLQLGTFSPDAAREAQRLVELDGMELPDALARKLLEEPDDRRDYLSHDLDLKRVRMVQSRLASFLAMAEPIADA